MQHAQELLFYFVQNDEMKKYFEKGIDFLCDVCYTVITEEQRASTRGTGTGEILIPGIPDSTER